MDETNDYVLIQSKKLAEIKYKALQKRSANLERPLSEASIEATTVIDVINYIYENNEWLKLAEEETNSPRWSSRWDQMR